MPDIFPSDEDGSRRCRQQEEFRLYQYSSGERSGSRLAELREYFLARTVLGALVSLPRE